jgi:ABC-type nitrate/sulfonate/bicarbonate transport system ATPase subunit
MLDITGLSKTYGGAGRDDPPIRVLDSVSFSVPKNQFVCLLGGSGCGKTTLLKIVAGLIAPDAGRIEIEGRAVTRPGSDRSLVFQNYGLLPWRNVLGNVEFGLEIRGVPRAQRREICRDYIKRVGLTGCENHFPHQISGGMQQRVGLARALSKDPKILLMDEPFAAVDMQTREHLQDELLGIWWTMKTTVLFVTHSIEEAIYLGDRVIVMASRPGRIAADILTELPRPRAETEVKSSARYAELQRQVRTALKEGQAHLAA